ncbi:putative transposase [Wolbachia endosymbiont of Cylisticus convexus]|nr:putative transposase [Wolbachia endosymbiont of Cylisticus convexus]
MVSVYKQCKLQENTQESMRKLSERNSNISVIKSCESYEKGKERWKRK